jgi:NitT/TauT family transport system substrate-binding protein
MKKSALISIVAVSALALSACGGSSGDSGGSAGTSSGGTTKITVGVLPVPDTAALYLGVDQGFFADEGLDVTVQSTTGGAVAVPGVVSGDYDFAFGNYVSGMVARDKGIDIQYVTNATTTPATGGFQAVVVPKDSPIQSPADLAGKTVSVNNLSNINDTTIRGVVDADGGDSSKIKFLELAFPDAVAAVEGGKVDAATVNPWTSDMESKFRVITYNFSGFDPDLDIAGFFTSGKTIKDDPELVKAFQTAMNKSLEYAQANPDEVRRIILTYTKLPEATLANLTLPVFRADVNRPALEKLGAAAKKYGTVSAEPDLDALLP